MPAAAPPNSAPARQHLEVLGQRLRQARKAQKVSAVAAAEAAGLSRVTLHRIERGEPGVAMGAWLAAAQALGLNFDLVGPGQAQVPTVPERIPLSEYPELRKLAWSLPGVDELPAREALQLYERSWRHVDVQALTPRERTLVEALTRSFGGPPLV